MYSKTLGRLCRVIWFDECLVRFSSNVVLCRKLLDFLGNCAVLTAGSGTELFSHNIVLCGCETFFVFSVILNEWNFLSEQEEFSLFGLGLVYLDDGVLIYCIRLCLWFRLIVSFYVYSMICLNIHWSFEYCGSDLWSFIQLFQISLWLLFLFITG